MKNKIFLTLLLISQFSYGQTEVSGKITDNDLMDVSNLFVSIGASGDVYLPNHNAGINIEFSYLYRDLVGFSGDFQKSFYNSFTEKSVTKNDPDRYGVPKSGELPFYELNNVLSIFPLSKEINNTIRIKSYVSGGEALIQVPGKQKILLGLRGGMTMFQSNYSYISAAYIQDYGYLEDEHVFTTMKGSGVSFGLEFRVVNNIGISINDAVSEHEKREEMKFYIDYVKYLNLTIDDITLEKKLEEVSWLNPNPVPYTGEISLAEDAYNNKYIYGIFRAGFEMKMLDKTGLYYGAEFGLRPGLEYNTVERVYLRMKVGLNLAYKAFL